MLRTAGVQNETTAAVGETGVSLGGICRVLVELAGGTTDLSITDQRSSACGVIWSRARPLNNLALTVDRETRWWT